MKKQRLIIVDMLNGFTKSGPLSDVSILKIVNNIKQLAKDKEVIFLNDAHKINSVEFNYFPIHCLEESFESEIIEELKYLIKENVIYKNSTNGFFALEKASLISDEYDYIITGCCSDICIMHLAICLKTYFNEINKDVKIRVFKNAVASFNNEKHDSLEYSDYAFKLMSLSGVEVL